MEQILLGMVGMALMLAAFAAGVRMAKSLASPCKGRCPEGAERSTSQSALTGCQLPLKGEPRAEARQASEAEAVQEAFETLLAYSAETAYGLNRGVRDNG